MIRRQGGREVYRAVVAQEQTQTARQRPKPGMDWMLAACGVLSYTAPTAETAEARFAECETDWGGRHPAIIRFWRGTWEEFTPVLAFPTRGSAGHLHHDRPSR